MVGHDLGDHGILLGELFLERGDLAFRRVLAGARVLVDEQGRRVLKEILLPSVEDRWLKAVLLAQIGERNLLDEVLAQNGDFLFGGEVTALFSYGFLLGAILHQIAPRESPNSTEAEQGHDRRHLLLRRERESHRLLGRGDDDHRAL